jgi:positive regulator of sigma E activity
MVAVNIQEGSDMPLSTSLISLLPVVALVVGYLIKDRLTNGDILAIALLAQLVIIIETMLGSNHHRWQYMSDLSGLRVAWAFLSVAASLGVAACAVFDVQQPASILCLSGIFLGQYMLIHSYWKRANAATEDPPH